MKHFTLAIVLLAVFASVALADRPSLKKKPVEPVAESVEEVGEELEKPQPKKPFKPSLKQKPEVTEAKVEKPLSNKPHLLANKKKPVAEDETPVDIIEESSDELSEEVVQKAPAKAKKPLPGAIKPKPLAADLNIQPPENVGDAEEPIELEPPTVGKKRPALVNLKA